jgi:hypothetical protein
VPLQERVERAALLRWRSVWALQHLAIRALAARVALVALAALAAAQVAAAERAAAERAATAALARRETEAEKRRARHTLGDTESRP